MDYSNQHSELLLASRFAREGPRARACQGVYCVEKKIASDLANSRRTQRSTWRWKWYIYILLYFFLFAPLSVGGRVKRGNKWEWNETTERVNLRWLNILAAMLAK